MTKEDDMRSSPSLSELVLELRSVGYLLRRVAANSDALCGPQYIGASVIVEQAATFIERAASEPKGVSSAVADAPSAHCSSVLKALWMTRDLLRLDYAESDPTTGEAIERRALPVWNAVHDALDALDAFASVASPERSEGIPPSPSSSDGEPTP